MALGAHSDEQLARGFAEAERAKNWTAADEYEDEFWRRRMSRFAGDKYDGEDTLKVWLTLRHQAGEDQTKQP